MACGACGAPIARGAACTLIARCAACTLTARGAACTLIARCAACTLIARGAACNLIARGAACTPIARGAACTLIARGAACTPIARGAACALIARGAACALIASGAACALMVCGACGAPNARGAACALMARGGFCLFDFFIKKALLFYPLDLRLYQPGNPEFRADRDLLRANLAVAILFALHALQLYLAVDAAISRSIIIQYIKRHGAGVEAFFAQHCLRILVGTPLGVLESSTLHIFIKAHVGFHGGAFRGLDVRVDFFRHDIDLLSVVVDGVDGQARLP